MPQNERFDLKPPSFSATVTESVVVGGVPSHIAELIRAAENDELVDVLLKRRTFGKKVGELLEKNKNIVLVFFDLDHFKRINDELGGHQAGDEVLIDFGEELSRNVRSTDEITYVARAGGDEFLAAIAFDLTQKEGMPPLTVEERAEGIKSHVHNIRDNYLQRRPDLVEAVNFNISIGFATCFEGEDKSIEQMSAEADEEMYADKQINHSLHN